MSFIDYLENIYQTEDIYRAIIVITGDTRNTGNTNDDTNDNNKIQNLIKDLKNKNHDPILITNEIQEIDYNYRLFIITKLDYLYKFKKNYYNQIIIY